MRRPGRLASKRPLLPPADSRRPARLAPAPSAAAVGEPGRDQRRGPAGAAVSCRPAAAGAVPFDAGRGQPPARRRRAVLHRAAQPHRNRRPRPLPRPEGVRARRAHRPRRPRTTGAYARLLSRTRDPARGQSRRFGLPAPGAADAPAASRSPAPRPRSRTDADTNADGATGPTVRPPPSSRYLATLTPGPCETRQTRSAVERRNTHNGKIWSLMPRSSASRLIANIRRSVRLGPACGLCAGHDA